MKNKEIEELFQKLFTDESLPYYAYEVRVKKSKKGQLRRVYFDACLTEDCYKRKSIFHLHFIVTNIGHVYYKNKTAGNRCLCFNAMKSLQKIKESEGVIKKTEISPFFFDRQDSSLRKRIMNELGL